MIPTAIFIAKFFCAVIVGAALLWALLIAADYLIDPT